MTVDFKRADLMLNGKLMKGLLKFDSTLGGHFPGGKNLVVWEYTHVAVDELPDQESDCDEGELEVERDNKPRN